LDTPAVHEQALPVPLTAIEARVLACLVEKAATTPDAYPLTENALTVACNQKTSREPVMQLDPGAVVHAVRALETRGMARRASSSQRALRYEHRFDDAYGTTARQRAVLCVLMLRGPQTLAELHARTDRIGDFPAVEDVADTLERLANREPTLVVRIPRSHGQREDRFMHLLCGPVDVDDLAARAQESAAPRGNPLGERVEQLEDALRILGERIEALEDRLRSAPADPGE
jgi:uncharacterized protein YceH (UPF0502 family)